MIEWLNNNNNMSESYFGCVVIVKVQSIYISLSVDAVCEEQEQITVEYVDIIDWFNAM